MPQFVAFLRGVNVGRAKRVPMAEFRELLLDLGYTEVRTLLNSGNAVFDAPKAGLGSEARSRRLAKEIREALVNRLEVDVAVIVKSAADLHAIREENAFADVVKDHSRLLVAMTASAADLAELEPVAALATRPDRMHVGMHAAYLWCPNGILESAAAEALLGKAGRLATTRSWATMRKILAAVESG